MNLIDLDCFNTRKTFHYCVIIGTLVFAILLIDRICGSIQPFRLESILKLKMLENVEQFFYKISNFLFLD